MHLVSEQTLFGKLVSKGLKEQKLGNFTQRLIEIKKIKRKGIIRIELNSIMNLVSNRTYATMRYSHSCIDIWYQNKHYSTNWYQKG